MALHPGFPKSPYAVLLPEQRWFPAAEELRSTAYEKLLPPLVAKIRSEVLAWRESDYAGASQTSRILLKWWFGLDHHVEDADGALAPFRYYFAQREAVETVIWLHDVRQVRDIDLAPKYIPAEVFDKRAVERGQVVFHDISFVEATPRYSKNKKDKHTLSIELTDFSVYYTQGAMESAIANLKEGKSQVVCEAGQLYKIAKNKQGVVTRDKLTNHWTDWVDYWAVDFDYMSRKEIIKVARGMGVEANLPGMEPAQADLPDFEERWTGGYIFENEWQSFRTRQDRKLELTTAPHTYTQPGRYTVAVKVIDIFGNDTMTLVPVSVG